MIVPWAAICLRSWRESPDGAAARPSPAAASISPASGSVKAQRGGGVRLFLSCEAERSAPSASRGAAVEVVAAGQRGRHGMERSTPPLPPPLRACVFGCVCVCVCVRVVGVCVCVRVCMCVVFLRESWWRAWPFRLEGSRDAANGRMDVLRACLHNWQAAGPKRYEKAALLKDVRALLALEGRSLSRPMPRYPGQRR